MINSMTGYGRAQEVIGNRDITVELRSVNNRYFDCNVRIPRMYTFAEDSIKTKIQGSISRGKVDVFVTIVNCGTDEISISLNLPVVSGYLGALTQMRDEFGLRDDISVSSLSRFSDVFVIEKEKEDLELLSQDISVVLQKALIGFNDMRRREGEKLAEDIEARLTSIETVVSRVEERSPQTVAEYCERLRQRMKDMLEGAQLEESRILTEAAIFADKIAVAEETVRLRSHISQMREMLNPDGPIGRKLDFLVQELNREANTIGSKGNDISMARDVVELKAEIEKIREQAQNIE